jgi:NAD(P)-dependent dehydrogenase (short-subunit alcohol dehydrogenase family)
MNIQDNVFIVTGAASGLGAATADALASAGGIVVGVDVKPGSDCRLIWQGIDVADEAGARTAVDQAVSRGRLFGLINCAGIAPSAKTAGPKGPHPLDVFATVIRVNLIGTFNMTRLAAQAMLDNTPDAEGQRGVIINTASVAAFEGQIGQVAYAASKAGVAGMTINIARDLAAFGIRCCTIAPGIFETPMLRGLPPSVQKALGASVPFPSRLGRASEYAKMAKAILENPMLNGETIRLDGALRMAPR